MTNDFSRLVKNIKTQSNSIWQFKAKMFTFECYEIIKNH